MDNLEEKLSGHRDDLRIIDSENSALLLFANSVTGNSDGKLGDAIRTLADGFGKGGSSAIDNVRLFIKIDAGDWIPFTKSDNWDAAVENGKTGRTDRTITNIAGTAITQTQIGYALRMIAFPMLIVPGLYLGANAPNTPFRAYLATRPGEPNAFGYYNSQLTKSMATTVTQSMTFGDGFYQMSYSKVAFAATEEKFIEAIALEAMGNGGAGGAFQLGHFLLPTPIPVVSGEQFKLTYRIEY